MIEDLQKNGVSQLPNLFTEEEIAGILSYLKDKNVYNCNIHACSNKQPNKLESPYNQPYASYTMQDAVLAPNVLAKALSCIELIRGYIECVPTLYTVHLWWSFAGHGEQNVQKWHRDFDDKKFCVILVYLVDVNEDNGPFCYQTGSHKNDGGPEFICVGKTGTTFVADNHGIHRGLPLKSGSRLVLWIRYGACDGWVKNVDGDTPIDKSLCPIKLTEEQEYITRLLFR